MPARVVEGVVQHYAWGDPDFIPELLGVPSRRQPWAELWLGTHPNGPTMLDNGTPLADLSGELPYLLKVLAAAEPLSLQVHPTIEQAEAGFETGVFGDPYDKPELLVALTEFDALCGFRPHDATVELLTRLGVDRLASAVEDHGAGAALRMLYRREIDHTEAITAAARAAGPEGLLVQQLVEKYGHDDPSVAATLLLNRITLQPGEALHLTAGNLHAYLRGCGIELMRASDNVVRGGLTAKHVDIELLLATVDPTPLAEPVMRATDGRYPLPEAGVELIRLEAGADYVAVGHELAIALDGTTLYLSPGTPVYTSAVTFVVTPL
jgi:mannose-6-phosphate isomerase